MTSKKDKLLVAAIDFGTTFSGYAFSFKHDYKADPLKISVNQNWVAGSRSLVSLKAPTCVLLNQKKEFEAFGYDAEDQYSELALDENHFDHYFFKRFKMILHECRVMITWIIKTKKKLLLRCTCVHHFKLDSINNMDQMHNLYLPTKMWNIVQCTWYHI